VLVADGQADGGDGQLEPTTADQVAGGDLPTVGWITGSRPLSRSGTAMTASPIIAWRPEPHRNTA